MVTTPVKNLGVFALALCLAVAISQPLNSAPRPLPAPDMTTKAGFDATCAALVPLKLKTRADMGKLSKQQLQAWVICKDVALAKQTATWAFKGFRDAKETPYEQSLFNNDIALNLWLKIQFSYMQGELSASRSVLNELQKTPLTKADALHLKPQTWQVDLDGDGQISRWEARFFALPNRSNDTEFNVSMPGEADDSDQVQLEALIKTDHTDVLWLLSYHEFIEGLLALAQSQRITVKSRFESLFTTVDKAAWARAHGLISKGLATSLAMRQSALAETDNDHEWIPNPQQTDSAFPLLLGQADYDTWGLVMGEFQLLWNGNTVLTANEFARGMLGSAANICAAGTGLDIPTLFTKHPPAALLNKDHYAAACSPVTAQRPESKLLKIAEQRAATNGLSSRLLRHFYWVN
jgi:hypothetical protein